MKIKDIINVLENIAPLSLQEPYDNAGLITGNHQTACTGIICCLDVTEKVLEEVIAKKCNLIIAHHPIIFRGIKRLNGKTETERTIINAIKHDIAIYAIHTKLDNVMTGVNGKIADLIGLTNRQILLPKEGILKKIYTFVPLLHVERLRSAIWNAGAGNIGNYNECSFNVEGTGTFKAGEHTTPFVGKQGELHYEKEVKVEIVFPAWLQARIVSALVDAHPYEEPAFDIITLDNNYNKTGSGITGLLTLPMGEKAFLQHLKDVFQLKVVKHTALRNKPIEKVTLCGGAGSFLISNALSVKSDIYITADIKYHEFFEGSKEMIIADIGHFESEQFTIDLLHDILREKFPNFAVLKTEVKTNPVFYYV